jgi:hypothetical protein
MTSYIGRRKFLATRLIGGEAEEGGEYLDRGLGAGGQGDAGGTLMFRSNQAKGVQRWLLSPGAPLACLP